MSTHQYKRNSRIICFILCLLGFIGLAGLHRIYTGHVLSGIIFFLTFGLLGLGTLFDLFNIVFDVFEDKAGYKLI